MKSIYTFICSVLILACTQDKQDLDSKYILKKVNEAVLPIDEGTLPYTKAMFSFREDGIDYLGYLNQAKNEILLYDLNKQSLTKKNSS